MNDKEFESRNPYAPPIAPVRDVAAIAVHPEMFFPVGLFKLGVMCVVTFGLYQFFWFYKQWKSVQRIYERKLNAPIRSLFYPLTAFSLFAKIRDQAKRHSVPASIAAAPLAVVLWVLSTLSRLPDPWWLISLLSFLPLLPAQDAINRLNRKLAPDQADENSGFTGWNIAAIAVCVALICLVIAGLMLPEEP